MRVRIVEGRVAELDPVLGAAECAMIVDVAPEVRVGWLWSPEGCTAPPETVEPIPNPNAYADAQIQVLEATVTQRRLREAALTEEGRDWLADVDAQIADLRSQRV